MLVQTRSEDSGLEEFATLKEAFDRAEEDKSIWKISFTISSGERVRLVREWDQYFKDIWVYEPIDKE